MIHLVTIYATAMKHSSWQTAWEFVGDCFELMYDAENPEEPILVMKIGEPSGPSIRFYVDGDLFCRATFWTKEGKPCGTLRWQGRECLKDMPMKEFINRLKGRLSVCVKQKSNAVPAAKKA